MNSNRNKQAPHTFIQYLIESIYYVQIRLQMRFVNGFEKFDVGSSGESMEYWNWSVIKWLAFYSRLNTTDIDPASFFSIHHKYTF